MTGEDPFDPSDDCQSAIDGMVDICPFVLANPTSPLALADCDGGGISNVVECMSGEDPLDPVDDCMAAISGMVDICAIVLADPTSPLATLDCDGGGVNNLTECMTGENPSDASDDCMSAVDSGLDICAIITADPTSPFATLDCDGGGIINSVECANGDDPLDPIDDNQSCMDVMASGESICDVLTADPNNPLATMDCDGGGVDNATECANGGDPADYRDECGVAMAAGLDICAIIAANPSAMIGMLDCDGGGIINSIECAAGLNPSNPSDDCDAAIDQNVNICNLISADPTHPLAALDCDGGGVNNANECASGENPLEWADDCQSAIDLGLDLCAFILANPTSLTALADCDGGGVNNLTECQNGGDPFDPADDCLVAVTTGLDICALIAANPTSPLALADCDGGGVNNFTECQTGNNPANPADDCMSALDFGIDICTIILNDPTHPLAFSDCDGGGVPNLLECQLGQDPFPSNCCGVVNRFLLPSVITNNPDGTASGDIVAVRIDGVVLPLSYPFDASSFGQMDALVAELTALGFTASYFFNNPNPTESNVIIEIYEATTVDLTILDGTLISNVPSDCCALANVADCAAAMDPSFDICAYVIANPLSLLAQADCDGGGVSNLVECQNGGDPFIPSDDCHIAITASLDICSIVLADPCLLYTSDAADE